MYFDQIEFGKRIKEERNRIHITQEELALQLNIGHVHMNSIENGRRGCSIDLLLDLSEIFGVSTDYLLTGKTLSNKETMIRLQGVLEDLEFILQDLGRK